jgi:hypothetical protein
VIGLKFKTNKRNKKKKCKLATYLHVLRKKELKVKESKERLDYLVFFIQGMKSKPKRENWGLIHL